MTSPITPRLEKQGADMASRDLSHAAGVKLDTSGYVAFTLSDTPVGPHLDLIYWTDLTPFAQGYTEAALKAAAEALYEQYWDTDWRPAFHRVAPETLARIIADCAAYQAWEAETANSVRAYNPGPRGEKLAEQIIAAARTGEDFWKHRNVPGRWFDRSIWPRLTPYLGDDGRVYLREEA